MTLEIHTYKDHFLSYPSFVLLRCKFKTYFVLNLLLLIQEKEVKKTFLRKIKAHLDTTSTMKSTLPGGAFEPFVGTRLSVCLYVCMSVCVHVDYRAHILT